MPVNVKKGITFFGGCGGGGGATGLGEWEASSRLAMEETFAGANKERTY